MPENSDPVEDLLLEAFDQEVRPGAVDERRLTAGTRGRLRHRRRVRRFQTVSAAVLIVVAVPLGVQLWPGSSVTTTPAQPTPTTSTAPTVQAPTPTATPPDVPLPEVPQFRAAIPAPLTLLGDGGPYPNELSPLAGLGVGCDTTSTAARSAMAREVEWVDETSENSDQMGVTLLLTRWADASSAVQGVVDGSGTCAFAYAQEPFEISVPGADETWAAVTDSDTTTPGTAFTQVSGLARVGDLVVGVSVQGPVPDREQELTDLLTAAVADLQGRS